MHYVSQTPVLACTMSSWQPVLEYWLWCTMATFHGLAGGGGGQLTCNCEAEGVEGVPALISKSSWRRSWAVGGGSLLLLHQVHVHLSAWKDSASVLCSGLRIYIEAGLREPAGGSHWRCGADMDWIMYIKLKHTICSFFSTPFIDRNLCAYCYREAPPLLCCV